MDALGGERTRADALDAAPIFGSSAPETELEFAALDVPEPTRPGVPAAEAPGFLERMKNAIFPDPEQETLSFFGVVTLSSSVRDVSTRPGVYRFFGPPIEREDFDGVRVTRCDPVPDAPFAPIRLQAALTNAREKFRAREPYTDQADQVFVTNRARIFLAKSPAASCSPVPGLCPVYLERQIHRGALEGYGVADPDALLGPPCVHGDGPAIVLSKHKGMALEVERARDARAAVVVAEKEARTRAEEDARTRKIARSVTGRELGVLALKCQVLPGAPAPVHSFSRAGVYVYLIRGYPLEVPTGQVMLRDENQENGTWAAAAWTVLSPDTPFEASPDDLRSIRTLSWRELQALNELRATRSHEVPASFVDGTHPAFSWYVACLREDLIPLVTRAAEGGLIDNGLRRLAMLIAARGHGDRAARSPLAPDLSARVLHEVVEETRKRPPSVYAQFHAQLTSKNYLAAIESGATPTEFHIPGASGRFEKCSLEDFAAWAQASLERKIPCDPFLLEDLERKFGVHHFSGWASDLEVLTAQITEIALDPTTPIGVCECARPMPDSFVAPEAKSGARDPWFLYISRARADGLFAPDARGHEHATNDQLFDLLRAGGEVIETPNVDEKRLAGVMGAMGAVKKNAARSDGTKFKAWIFGDES